MSERKTVATDPNSSGATGYRITQISPPIFPEDVVIEVRGGVLKLLFFIVPDLYKPNEICIVSDIVSTPAFALGIIEQMTAVLQGLDLPSVPREEEVKRYRDSYTTTPGGGDAERT
jgi:hypothetical protein